MAYERQIELPEDWKGGLQDEHGNDHPVQQDMDGKLSALVRLAPQEIHPINAIQQAKKADSLIPENQLVRYEFNQHAQLAAALDLETGDSDGDVEQLAMC